MLFALLCLVAVSINVAHHRSHPVRLDKVWGLHAPYHV